MRREAVRVVSPEGGGCIPKIEKIDREFRRGYGSGVNDAKGMNFVDIVRVVEGNLGMSMMVYYLHHGGKDVSERYLKGWAQAIRDSHKRTEGVKRSFKQTTAQLGL